MLQNFRTILEKRFGATFFQFSLESSNIIIPKTYGNRARIQHVQLDCIYLFEILFCCIGWGNSTQVEQIHHLEKQWFVQRNDSDLQHQVLVESLRYHLFLIKEFEITRIVCCIRDICLTVYNPKGFLNAF